MPLPEGADDKTKIEIVLYHVKALANDVSDMKALMTDQMRELGDVAKTVARHEERWAVYYMASQQTQKKLNGLSEKSWKNAVEIAKWAAILGSTIGGGGLIGYLISKLSP